MTTARRSGRLGAGLAEMADVEMVILEAVSQLGDRVTPYSEAQNLFADIDQMARDHLLALRGRLQTMTGNGLDIEQPESAPESTDQRGFPDLHPVSSSLRALYTLLHQAIIGYSTLSLVAVRFRDSWVAESTGTTAHIARAHTQEYMAAVGRITEIIHDVVRWELDEDGLECRCTCPSCGIGLCVGPVSTRAILSEAWNAARPPVAETGVTVPSPRVGSAADDAGFRQGDVIVAVDGVRVDSPTVLQKAVRDHRPADRFEFRVRRNEDVVSLVAERRSDLGVEPEANEEDCVQPAGSDFYLGRARDIQKRVHQHGSRDGVGPIGLSSLSAREIQVLRLAADGASNPRIAEELGIRRATVARHIANILEKLGAANRTEAVSMAATGGLLSYA